MGNSNDLKPVKCGCTVPCACNPPTPCTRCNGDTKNNMWVERANQPGNENAPGICLLDTLQDWQIVYTLEHNPRAKADLLRVTTDPHLLELANTVTLLPTPELVDMEQSVQNKEYKPES